MKYFEVTNSNRNIRVTTPDKQTLTIPFLHYERTGTWMGVYATGKADEIAALDLAVKDAKSGIREISQECFDDCLKKKSGASNSYATSLANSQGVPGASAPAGAPSAAGSAIDTMLPGEQVQAAPINSVEEAITPVPVAPK